MHLLFKILKLGYIRKLLVILVFDVGLFSTQDAKNDSSLIIMLGFILLLLTIYYICCGILSLLSLYGIKPKHPRYLALSFSGVLGGLIALQSVGELSLHDLFVLIPLGLIAYFYSSYGSSSKRSKTSN